MRSLSRFGVKLRYEIPHRVRNLPKKAYKREIRQILVNENDYIKTCITI